SVETIIHVELAPGATMADSEPLFVRSESELAKDHDMAAALSGEPMPALRAWRRVHVKGTRSTIDKELARLRDRSDVITAFEAPVAELPLVRELTTASGSCPIKTPNYHERQSYLR